MTDHIVLISEDDRNIRFARAVATACNAKLAISSTLGGIEGLSDSESLRSVFLDTTTRNILDEFEAKFGGSFSRNKICAIIAPEKRAHAEEMADFEDIGHVLIANFPGDHSTPEASGRHFARIVAASSRKDLNGLGAFFPSDCEMMTKEIRESLQKRFIVEAVNTQLTKKMWHPKMASSIATAIDEMIMNAIFDAPLDENGQQKYQALSRAAAIDLGDEAKVEIQIGFDESYFGVSVIDQFGTLNRRNVLRHVFKAFSEGGQTIARTDQLQGAGLGLALILRSGGSLSFACDPGKKSEVTAFFGKTDSFLQFRNQFQFVSTQFD